MNLYWVRLFRKLLSERECRVVWCLWVSSMAYWGQGQEVQNRPRIQVWLYEQVNMRIEGCIIGFDEYMNLLLDDAEEIHSKIKKTTGSDPAKRR